MLIVCAPMKSTAQIIHFADKQSIAPLGSLLRAAGDDLRLRILRVLAQDSFSVSELCMIFDLRQSALSHHLKILIDAGLLDRRKEGTAVFYHRALTTGPHQALQEQIFTQLDAESLPTESTEGIARVQQQREQNSQVFFKGNVARFRAQQELIAPWADYSEMSLQLLDRLDSSPLGTIAEIGVGEGWLLPHLHERAARVIALDLSEEMLSLARDHAGHLAGIEFVQGSTDALLASGAAADAVIANMVLHHAPDPRGILADTANLLTPSGALIVSELCAHDQAWAREHCGDLWLGFSPEAIEAWAVEAGLKTHASVFLAQRNGFQIQVQHFERC